MQKITTYSGSTADVSFRADRPMISKPVIDSEFTDGGVRFYRTDDDRVFNADVYDRNFGTAKPGRVRTAAEARYLRRRFGR